MALTDNVIAYYKLENENDSVGTKHFTNANSVGFASGKILNAADFGSSNSSKRLYKTPDVLTYSELGTGWTMSFWIYCQSTSSNNRITRYILNNGTLERNFNCDFNTSGNIVLAMFDGSNRSITSSSTFSTNTWYHVVALYDGAMKLYVNNSSEGTTGSFSWGGFSRNTLSNWCVGAEQLTSGGGASEYFKGLIDEVGVWNRALTTDEISTLYNGGSGLTYPFTVASAFVPRASYFM